MLSFLKQGSDTLAKLNSSADAGSAQGSENGADDGFIKPVHHAKNLRQSTMVLVILFAVGAVCLWFMVKKTVPQKADAAVSGQDVEIENAIAQITGIRSEVGGRADDIISRFHQISDVKQVGVDDLKKNPFRHNYSRFAAESQPSQEDTNANDELIRQESIRRKAAGLQLEGISIMKPDKESCCMINERILYVGDKTEDFTITRITAGNVELTQNGVVVLLKLAE